MTSTQPHSPSEQEWELWALEELAEHGWEPKKGADIAPGKGERTNWEELLIPSRLQDALIRLNPDLPVEHVGEVIKIISTPSSADAILENQIIHRYLTGGFRKLTYTNDSGAEVTPTIRLISNDPDDNEWLAINQVTITRGEHKRRFDIVLYVNGMPISMIELKKASSEQATVAQAHAQLQTYLHEFPMAFRFVVFNLISDGIIAQYGTPFTPLNHFSPWNVDDDGRRLTPQDFGDATPMDIAISGLYNQERFLQLLRGYTAFDEDAGGLTKRIAKPHQYFAVSKAIGNTVHAVESHGKAGVVWHTQGSGKSMEMELYASHVIRHPKLGNPTIVVITDRNELDGQLYETFAKSQLLPEKPRQIRKRSELRDELTNRVTGGIYFTTLQKFGLTKEERDSGATHPLLSDRRNIIVVVDEAHRSHYDDLDGYARHLRGALPNATLIAFTGTPVSFADRNTREVFGDYIDIYDLTRAIEDGATVPVYFESRLVKVGLADNLTEDAIDAAADEATVGLDVVERERVEQGVAALNAIYGAPERLEQLAQDLVGHWERRRAEMGKFIDGPGKAMVVGATRTVCANLYDAIIKLRPDWHSDDLAKGKIKVVYSGTAADQPPVSRHVRRDSENAVIKKRVKDIDDELEIVIVKDMMLTGFDAPPLHTLYLDRPIKGALLMQTLARVNRTYQGKSDGLLVAYAPVADNLADALAEYTDRDQATKPMGRDLEGAVDLAARLVEQLEGLLTGYDWRAVMHSDARRGWRTAALGATNYLRDPATPGNQVKEEDETLASRYRSLSSQLSRVFALCVGADLIEPIRLPARFFEDVRVWMAKFDAEERQQRGEALPEDVARILRRLVDTTVDASAGVLDIYQAAGMPPPRIDDINVDFIRKAKQAKNPHLAIEALRKLVNDEAKKVTHHNAVRQRAFSGRVQELMTKYTNQQLTSAEVIAALIEVAKEVAVEADRGAHFDPPLSSDELAFYDAVNQNESAVKEQGEGVLADIARDLVQVMKRDIKTDWTVREDVKAKLRSSIKRLLVIHGYPPDKQPAAIKQVLEQMEMIAPSMAQPVG